MLVCDHICSEMFATNDTWTLNTLPIYYLVNNQGAQLYSTKLSVSGSLHNPYLFKAIAPFENPKKD